MDVRDAFRNFRSELNITQSELANALHVNVTTISRWELGKSLPNRSVFSLLLGYAYTHSASKQCVDSLKQAVNSATKLKRRQSAGNLFTVEHSSLVQFVEESLFPIYVCEINTDEILYANKAAEEMIGETDGLINRKCYECIMHRDTPCGFCHKNQLVHDSFIGFTAVRPPDNRIYQVYGKLIRWNGHEAQVRYVMDSGHTADISLVDERKMKYDEQLRIRKSITSDRLASVYCNLTDNTVSDVLCNSQDLQKLLSAGSVNSILRLISENASNDAERQKNKSIADIEALLRLYYMGKSRITVEHYLNDDDRLYESVFDLFQNPVTYDIEAFFVLRDVSDSSNTKLY